MRFVGVCEVNPQVGGPRSVVVCPEVVGFVLMKVKYVQRIQKLRIFNVNTKKMEDLEKIYYLGNHYLHFMHYVLELVKKLKQDVNGINIL
jgi:hypothetical protein